MSVLMEDCGDGYANWAPKNPGAIGSAAVKNRWLSRVPQG
jgi:hypothetical protein